MRIIFPFTTVKIKFSSVHRRPSYMLLLLFVCSLCCLVFNLFKMLKVPSVKKYVIQNLVEIVFSTDGNIWFWKICETEVNVSNGLLLYST